MKQSYIRIGGSIVIGILFVVSAMYLAEQSEKSGVDSVAVAVTTGKSLRTFIPVTDSVYSGVPDWQAALVRTEPLVVTYEPTTQEFVSDGTLSERFGLDFFKSTIRSKYYGPFGSDVETIMERLIDEALVDIEPDFYSVRDLQINPDTSRSAIRDYGNQLAQIILRYPLEGNPETVVLHDTVVRNDEQKLRELEPILLAYRGLANDIIQTPVPRTYVQEHLNMANTYFALAHSVEAMKLSFEDPLASFIRLKTYDEDVRAMLKSLADIYQKLIDEDRIQFGEEDTFTKLMSTIIR